MGLTILWDNDGVLVDTEALYFRATQSVLQTVDIELTRERFIEHSLRRGRSLFDLAAERGIGTDQIERLRAERNLRYEAALRSRNCAIDGVGDVLRRLHGRVRMGVVTGSLRRHFDLAHARTGFRQFFHFVVAHDDYEHSKPHPDAYLTALRRNQLEPDDCIAFEDSERGVVAAVAAELRCFAVPGELTRDEEFAGAEQVLGSIRDVPAVVARLMMLPEGIREGEAPAEPRDGDAA